jgi:glycosyltransferase involved in cell wall biosynthesis
MRVCNGKVSILMNCFNGEKYLSQAIESILSQSFNNWEVIFWDNQSTDESASIFKAYSDSRLKYFYAPRHTFLYEARILALKHAEGEFIAFLDVDDWWMPNKLEKQIPLFNDLSVGFACSNYLVVNQSKARKFKAYIKKVPSGRVLGELLRNYYVGLVTLVIRRSALDYLEKDFDPRFHIIGDFDLTVRLSATFNLAVTQEVLACYRIHGENESAKHFERHLAELEMWWLDNKADPIIGKSINFDHIPIKILYLKSLRCLLSGERLLALKFLKKIPFGRVKFQLFLAFMLPTTMLRHFKN